MGRGDFESVCLVIGTGVGPEDAAGVEVVGVAVEFEEELMLRKVRGDGTGEVAEPGGVGVTESVESALFARGEEDDAVVRAFALTVAVAAAAAWRRLDCDADALGRRDGVDIVRRGDEGEAVDDTLGDEDPSPRCVGVRGGSTGGGGLRWDREAGAGDLLVLLFVVVDGPAPATRDVALDGAAAFELEVMAPAGLPVTFAGAGDFGPDTEIVRSRTEAAAVGLA